MRTGLYDHHIALGAKMVNFAGWEMPLQYVGIIPEHNTVREKAGLFDVSHMGRIVVKGPEAATFMDYLSVSPVASKKDFSATYTVWCLPTGGTVDDLIVYKQNAEHFFVIVNASNRKKDLDHVLSQKGSFEVTVEERYDDGIIALQGPLAMKIVSKVFKEAAGLKPMHFASVLFQGEDVILSATGYTGAGGVEIYAPMSSIIALWELFLELGKPEGIQPIGLGARDTLRLEMGYALYGHELSELIAPSESVSAWTVKSEKGDFLGKEALQQLQVNGRKRMQYGIVLTDRGIAREGYQVFSEDSPIGVVTSGTQSPTLNQAIAIIMVEKKLEEGENVQVQVRHQKCRAKVVKLPFLK